MDAHSPASEWSQVIRNIFGAIFVLFDNGFGRVSRTASESSRRSRRSEKMQLSSFLEDMVQGCAVRHAHLVVSSAFTCLEEYGTSEE